MVIILGDDANAVDHEVYRIRNCGEAVYGACSVRALRDLLLKHSSEGATIRAIPAHYERSEAREVVLHKLPARAVDEVMANLGS